MNHLARTLEENPHVWVRSIVIEQEWNHVEKYNKEGLLKAPLTTRVTQALA